MLKILHFLVIIYVRKLRYKQTIIFANSIYLKSLSKQH